MFSKHRAFSVERYGTSAIAAGFVSSASRCRQKGVSCKLLSPAEEVHAIAMRSSERCGSSESDDTPRQENNMMKFAENVIVRSSEEFTPLLPHCPLVDARAKPLPLSLVKASVSGGSRQGHVAFGDDFMRFQLLGVFISLLV